jgi:DNA-binding transcriptional ArsR family regulator
MRKRLLLREPGQVKVLADPLRIRILEALRQQPLSPRQAAEQLGLKPTRLYHHFATLERAGLIQLAATRPRRGAVERLYRPVARELVVDRALFEDPGAARTRGASVLRFAESAFELTLSELRDGVKAGALPLAKADRMELGALRVRVPASAVPELVGRVRELLLAAQAAEDERGTEVVRLAVALFPVTEAPKPSRSPARRGKHAPARPLTRKP